MQALVNPHSEWYVTATERLAAVVQQLAQTHDVDTVTTVVCDAARDLTGADGATFILRDGDRCYYTDEKAISPLWKGRRFPLDACISGWVMTNACPVVIEDVYRDPRIPREAYKPTFVKTLAMVPIRRTSPIGAVGTYWATHRRPTDEEVGVLQSLADTASVALANVRLEAKLRHLAYRDQLTELPNLESLHGELGELLRLGVEARSQTALALFNLDCFKQVNDAFGRSAGDQLLKVVAERLSTAAYQGARLYRPGGDEFVAVIPHCGNQIEIKAIVDTMLSNVAEHYEIDGRRIQVTASAGVAIAPADGSTVDELIANADLALRQAKAERSGTVRFFIRALRVKVQLRNKLEHELRHAFERQQFEIYFQPQIRLVDEAVVGAEALLRWRHPERGVLSPSAYVDVLTKSVIAPELGTWILEQACLKAASWRASGTLVRVGVNVFPHQLQDGKLASTVAAVLRKTGLPGEALEIEITENIALNQNRKMVEPLRTLRTMGVGIAFDDFGTGYASLSCLTKYPITRVKVDRSFVLNATAEAEHALIVRVLIGLAHGLGLEVTAEGVETPAHAAFLRSQGCQEAQGYLYARPLPAEGFERYLRDRAAVQEQARYTA